MSQCAGILINYISKGEVNATSIHALHRDVNIMQNLYLPFDLVMHTFNNVSFLLY